MKRREEGENDKEGNRNIILYPEDGINSIRI
jgi:hypothetical protein